MVFKIQMFTSSNFGIRRYTGTFRYVRFTQ